MGSGRNLVFFAAAPASAQCTYHWLLGEGLPGLSGRARAAVVYDDGTDPALYLSGEFTIVGEVAANNIAKWDGTSWRRGRLRRRTTRGVMPVGGPLSRLRGRARLPRGPTKGARRG